jgi:hypothetical protein
LASKEYEQALEILNWEEMNPNEKISPSCFDDATNFSLNGRNVIELIIFLNSVQLQNKLIVVKFLKIKIEAAINLLRGKIHEALGCSDAAIECYKATLTGDVFCYEALQSLSSNHMLTPKAGKEQFINIKI